MGGYLRRPLALPSDAPPELYERLRYEPGVSDQADVEWNSRGPGMGRINRPYPGMMVPTQMELRVEAEAFFSVPGPGHGQCLPVPPELAAGAGPGWPPAHTAVDDGSDLKVKSPVDISMER